MRLEILPEPILVGRSIELRELTLRLDDMLRGKGTTVFVSGEAGSGKTRLMNEFLSLARMRGVTVLSGWCLSNAVVPYFPFVEAFDSYVSGNEGNSESLGTRPLVAKSLLIGSDSGSNVAPQAWRDQTFATVAKELLLISSSTPLVLFIDDLHWADSASLALLHYVARSIASERILVLATFRSEEIAAEGHGHQLVETLRLMGREDLFSEIRLSGLSQADVGGIAESMLDGKVHESFVEKLATESRGIPLFVVESLRMLHEEGVLIQENGQWCISIEELGIPAKIKDIVLRRIDALKPAQRRVLDAASVVGEKFDPKLVAAVVSQERLDVLESLDAISHGTLLVACEGDCYRFDHAKSREMLYNRIPSPLKREYHSRIAEKLESASPNIKGPQVTDLAYHYAQAGNKEKSVKYAIAAGKDALARFSNKEALNHFAYVLQMVEKDSEYLNERETALEGLGEALFANSMFLESIKTFEQLSDSATGVVKLRALRRAMDGAFFQGDFAHLLELTRKTEGYAAVDRLESARVLMNRARAVMFLGDPEAGRRDFEASLRILEEEYSLPDVARTSLGLGGIYGGERGDIGLARVLRAVVLFKELDDARGLMDASNRAGQSFGYRLLAEEALDMNEETVRIGKEIGAFNRMAEARASSAWFLETSSDFAGALTMSLEALEYCRKTDSDWTRAMTYSNLVRLYAKLGDVEHAEEYFQELLKLPGEVISRSSVFVQFGLSRAVLFAAKHSWNEANQYFDEYVALAESLDLVRIAPWIEILNRLYYAWVLDEQNRIEEAERQLDIAQKIVKHVKECFEHVAVQAMLMAPREIELGQEFAPRLDIVNVSRKPCVLLGVEGLIPPGVSVKLVPDFCSPRGSLIAMSKRLEPFQVETVKLNLEVVRSGVFAFEPQILYVDDIGQKKALRIGTVSVAARSVPAGILPESAAAIAPAEPEFKSEEAQKAFEFLVSAFVEDYGRRRLPQERSGWRTLMDIAKQGRVSKYSMYGSSGGRGYVFSELEHLGLVEARVFAGERGRGGKILKLRVSCESEFVRRQIGLRDK